MLIFWCAVPTLVPTQYPTPSHFIVPPISELLSKCDFAKADLVLVDSLKNITDMLTTAKRLAVQLKSPINTTSHVVETPVYIPPERVLLIDGGGNTLANAATFPSTGYRTYPTFSVPSSSRLCMYNIHLTKAKVLSVSLISLLQNWDVNLFADRVHQFNQWSGAVRMYVIMPAHVCVRAQL